MRFIKSRSSRTTPVFCTNRLCADYAELFLPQAAQELVLCHYSFVTFLTTA